jgi:hypothetical protein
VRPLIVVAIILVVGGLLLAALQAAGNAPSAPPQPASAKPAREVLQTRIEDCQAMRRDAQNWQPKQQQAYREGCWQRAEGDNGAIYLIDLGLIQSFGGGATTSIYTDEGGQFNVMNLKRWYFTCEGHFSVMDDAGLSPAMYAPPHSVARYMSDVVCAGVGVNRLGLQRAPPAAISGAQTLESCTQEDATEIIRSQRTLEAANDPCVVHWRSIEVRRHPERAADLECAGLKAYGDPQPPGHPISLSECERMIREGQEKMGLPVRGMTDEQKAVYRATWGN